jgi:hypothetical protein
MPGSTESHADNAEAARIAPDLVIRRCTAELPVKDSRGYRGWLPGWLAACPQRGWDAWPFSDRARRRVMTITVVQ